LGVWFAGAGAHESFLIFGMDALRSIISGLQPASSADMLPQTRDDIAGGGPRENKK
jgi:hypothetical protein